LGIGLQLECVYQMFISRTVWMIPVDTSVEWPKTEIWGWIKGFFMPFIYF